MDTRWLRIVALIGVMGVASLASAQEIAWQRRIEVDVPAGVGLKTITPSARDQASSLSVAVVTYVTFEDRYQYRVVATDPSNGSLRWNHDFGAECSYESASQALVATLAGGDIAVAIHGQDRSTNLRHVCVARLRATDGGLVWARAEQTASGHAYIHAMSARVTGELLLAGRSGALARIQAWDAASGTTLWQRDIAESGSSLQAVSIADGPGNFAAMHLLVTTGTTRTSRLVGLDLNDGSTRWSQAGCVGATFDVDGQQAQTVLRVFDDGTLMQVQQCYSTSTASMVISRHNNTTGTTVWQRELPQTFADAIIRDDRSVLLAGALLVDGVNAGLARLSGSGGATLWAAPRAGGMYRMTESAERVFLLEMDTDVSGYVAAFHLAVHDLASGAQLARPNIDGLPLLMLADRVHLGAFADGDVVVAGMSGDNRSAGSRLSAVRLRPGVSPARWLANIPVMATHPFMVQGPWTADKQLVATPKGARGVVTSGFGLLDSGYAYPRTLKLDSRNGRVLWTWQPDGRRNGSIRSTLATADGDIVIAGDDGSAAIAPLLERLNGATGAVIWKHVAPAGAAALDAALFQDGAIAMVTGTINTRVARHAAMSGERLWDVPVPDGRSSDPVDHRLVAHADGNITLVGRYQTAASEIGIHVVRLRGSDGLLLWRRALSIGPGVGTDFLRAAALPDGDIAVHARGEIWRVDGGSGSVEWHVPEPFFVGTLVIVAGDIAVAGYSNGRAVARLRGSDGAMLWTRVLPPANPLHPGETLTALSLGSDGRLLAAGGDGIFAQHAVALDPADGSTLWQVYASMDQRGGGEATFGENYWPVGILQGPDGNVFFGGNARPYPESMTVIKVTGAFADGIFADGFE